MNEINLKLRLTEAETWALAGFLKRVGWRECRENTASPEEAEKAMVALWEIKDRLEEAGYIKR